MFYKGRKMYLFAKVKKTPYEYNAEIFKVKTSEHAQHFVLVATFKGFPRFFMLKKAIDNFAKSKNAHTVIYL